MTVEEQKNCPVTSLKLGAMGEPDLDRGRGAEGLDLLRRLPAEAEGPAREVPVPARTRAEGRGVERARVVGDRHRHAKVVYVEAEPGVFEGRVVVLGQRIGDRFPVLEGLAPGEKVAAAGTFLIDAESRLNPGVAPAESPGPVSTVAPTPRPHHIH